MANPDEKQNSNKVTRRGLLLKETRERKGLSIETVHEMTKIPLDVLHAIEEGYTVRMVSAYYFKGFIKMYAKFLGLDFTLVLDEPVSKVSSTHEDSDENVSVVSDPQHRKFNEYITRQNKKQTIVGLIILGICVVIALIVLVIWMNRPQSGNRVPVVKVKKEVPKKKFLENQIADRKMLDKTKKKSVAETKPEVRPVAAQTRQAAVTEVVEDVVSERNKEVSNKKVSLTIKSRAAGWLQVKVDGNLVFQSTLRAGAAESWQGEKSIELSGKNINNLEFEVNGKVLGQLGKSDRGARRVLVTSDGLSVKK
ncbi:MAG: DUF4115 domain-containing protein [Candidatus Omnitrophica bacterium]|nr:DUF4115 domain-containing protein [Candidatus Omnitrophota bacterium]